MLQFRWSIMIDRRDIMARTIPAVEEIAHRAQAIYEGGIRQKVEGDHNGQIVMIDIDSGDFEIDDYLLPAADRIKARHPEATLYPIRIGYDAIYSFRPRRARPKR